MPTLIHERVESAIAGKNPYVIGRVSSGWVVIGDVQFLKGYCLLLADPVVSSLNDLSAKQREVFLLEMSVVGDAILSVTDAYRINYEILGNSEAALHAHIFPRFEWEPDAYRTRPVWFYDRRDAPLYSADEHAPLQEAIRNHLVMEGMLQTR